MVPTRSGVVVLPFVHTISYVRDALQDASLQLGRQVRVLLIDNGSTDEERHQIDRMIQAPIYEADPPLLWRHDPPLPSLAATWNLALSTIWQCGYDDALVINADVRLAPWTYEVLRTAVHRYHLWWVSPVNDAQAFRHDLPCPTLPERLPSLGGPDFSCFLITKQCHDHYLFDPQFVPAYCEDVDYHRRLLLGDQGARISSIAVPYLHHASATLKEMSPDDRHRLEDQIGAGSRAHYARKWGGPVNEEPWRVPFSGGAEPHASWTTTPQLFAKARQDYTLAHEDQQPTAGDVADLERRSRRPQESDHAEEG